MLERRLYRLLMTFMTLSSLAACGGAGEIGEACSKQSDPDECVDEAFCAKNKSAELECMQICTSQSDCPEKTECTGSKETIKVCQPK
jgi:hypothetical protein